MDVRWMTEALEIARPARPHPNPRVGAILLDQSGVEVGRGRHEGPGHPHAETVALEQAGSRASGGTLYVTLEPCSHHGRTPPCTDAIIAAGVQRVVVAVEDPDARVSGRGIDMLRRAGITVDVGVLAEAAVDLDPGYFHHRRTGRPFVILKCAVTLDGQMVAADGTSQWITGREARADAHKLRSDADAVMVGAGTLRQDDPRLDVRLDGFEGTQPVPVIVAGSREIPADAAVLARHPIILTPRPLDYERAIVVPDGDRVDLTQGLTELGSRGLVDVLVEGGPTLARALLDANLIDRVVIYYGAVLAGGSGRSMFSGSWTSVRDIHRAEIDEIKSVGEDLRVSLSLERA